MPVDLMAAVHETAARNFSIRAVIVGVAACMRFRRGGRGGAIQVGSISVAQETASEHGAPPIYPHRPSGFALKGPLAFVALLCQPPFSEGFAAWASDEPERWMGTTVMQDKRGG